MLFRFGDFVVTNRPCRKQKRKSFPRRRRNWFTHLMLIAEFKASKKAAQFVANFSQFLTIVAVKLVRWDIETRSRRLPAWNRQGSSTSRYRRRSATCMGDFGSLGCWKDQLCKGTITREQDFVSQNPNSSHQSSGTGIPAYSHPPRKFASPTPVGLTVLFILCIILGGLGFVGSCAGGVMFAFQQQFQAATLKNAPPDQVEMQKKINESQADFLIANIALLASNLIIAPLILCGGIAGLMRKPWARSLLRNALIAAATFITIRMGLGVVAQLSMLNVIADAAGDASTAAIMQASFVAGIIFGLVFFLAQLGFYIWGIIYLNKPHIKAHFQG